MHPPTPPNPQTYPYNSRYASILQYNPTTNEPFIALPAPHSNLRLTPPRFSDAEDIMPIMNNLDVCINFAGPPFPYLREHCDAWLRDRVSDYEKAMTDITNVHEDVGYLGIFPLGHIREVAPDGTETFVGDIELMRESGFMEVQDVEARAAKVNMNLNLPPGDPDIVWTIGDYLRPSHHKRGIMTAVVKTLIESWAVPHMGARKFHAAAFPHNIPSHKVFLRNGFEFAGTIVGAVQFPESKGGQLMDSWYFERTVSSESA